MSASGRTDATSAVLPSIGPFRIVAVGLATVLLTTAIVASGNGRSDAFAADNAAAMDRMMKAMEIRPSGDVDADFAATMIPHHQGAIDMAVAELRYGRNEQLRRIAQEIVVEQQQEIAAMELALGRPLPPSTPSPTLAMSRVLPDVVASTPRTESP